MRKRKGLLSTAAITLIIGLAGLTHLMEQPRFQSFHHVDVVQLLASGMCFGVALVALVTFFRKPSAS